ncbi:WG repeat-containing protein [Campylobacter lari]|nr:WG repeat-containing protein [Campylobacter lari]
MLNLFAKHKIKFAIAFVLPILAFGFDIYYNTNKNEIHTTNPNKQNNKYEILKEKCNSGDIKACLDSYPIKYKKPIQAKLNGKWGFIDKNGEIIINPIFDNVSNFKENLASVKINGKWGFINESGKFITEPIFNYAWNFKENFASIRLKEKWGFINKNGNIAIKPIFDYTLDFNENLAGAKLNGKWGFIDKSGKIYNKTYI